MPFGICGGNLVGNKWLETVLNGDHQPTNGRLKIARIIRIHSEFCFGTKVFFSKCTNRRIQSRPVVLVLQHRTKIVPPYDRSYSLT